MPCGSICPASDALCIAGFKQASACQPPTREKCCTGSRIVDEREMDGNTGNPKVSKRMCRERSGRPKHERNQCTEFICEDKNLCPLKFRIYVRIFRRLGCFFFSRDDCSLDLCQDVCLPPGGRCTFSKILSNSVPEGRGFLGEAHRIYTFPVENQERPETFIGQTTWSMPRDVDIPCAHTQRDVSASLARSFSGNWAPISTTRGRKSGLDFRQNPSAGNRCPIWAACGGNRACYLSAAS